MSKRSFTLRGMAIGLAMLMFACSEDLENKMGPPDVTQDIAADMDMDGDVVSFSDQLVANQYIVVFKKEKTGYAGARFSDPKQASEHVKKQALSIVRSVAPAFSEDQILWVYSFINGAAIKLSDDKIEALRNDERVASISQDRIITLAKPGSDGGSAPSETTPPGITRVNGGLRDCTDETPEKSNNVAWVIDTGVDFEHDDLNVDKLRSKSFISTEKTADDLNGHGTHVAGTIAAIDNEIGVVGVAPGATVVAVKVLDRRGGGTWSGVMAGVNYVGENGKPGDVANMSLGGGKNNDLNKLVQDVSALKGIYFSLAAGNDNIDASNYSPASAEGDKIFTISAMDIRKNGGDTSDDDLFAYFSNYGNSTNGAPIDYCAPGVSVLSTYKDNTYKYLSGTSMAAPHAAGVLLFKSIHGGEVSSGGTANDPSGYDADPVDDHIIYYAPPPPPSPS